MVGNLLTEANAISKSSPAIKAYAVDQATQFIALQKQVAGLVPSSPSSTGGLPHGWYDVHQPPFSWPKVSDDISAQVQASLANAPRGAVLALHDWHYIFNLDHGSRPDLTFWGVPSGMVGNKNASDPDVGTWVQPSNAKPAFTCVPTWQANVAPTYAHLQGDLSSQPSQSFIRVGNCNNGRIWSVGAKYGRAVVFNDGGSDSAYWDVRDIRSYQNQYGLLLAGNFGWNVSGVNLFMADGQAGIYLTRAAQNNRFTLVMTDGNWIDSSQHVGGVSVLGDGQAHHNYFTLFKFESTNPAVHLSSPDSSTQSPTRAFSFDHGVIGGRYGTSIAFQIDQWVDQTYLGDDLAFVSGSVSPIVNSGTNTRLPSKLRLS